jgi:hypothetical protein
MAPSDPGDLSAQVVGPPALYELFDALLILDFLVENFASKGRKFGVAGETQGDELARPKFRDSRLEIRGKQLMQTHALFQADNAILDPQREYPRQKNRGYKSSGDKDAFQRSPGELRGVPAVKPPEKVEDENWRGEEVERRHPFCVVGKSLWGLF